jgi:phosphoribosyl-ATP pyrophosphohydrolase/phosphoribosyl-AMP cyclohydrolase/histidinol dehydrogenase
MTAIPARVAGVKSVVVATPGRDPVMLAAAAIAGADLVLRVGGAHAVAAMAFGVGVPACDVIVGPGNRWVTAAKHVVSAFCGIDMLAGPSELLVIADGSADPALVAADLIAQAEHDPDALPCLVTTDGELVGRVSAELGRQLADLPTAAVARRSIRANGWACVVRSIEEAVAISDRVAPEHLEILCDDAERVARLVRHAGGVFIGERAAEVLGDYGAGPNHTLPTSRTGRVRGGLCVFDFLRVRTWLRMDAPSELAADAAALGRIEGLEGHARSAERRAGK